MQSLKHPLLWLGVIYFLILLSVALWVRDIAIQPDVFDFTRKNLEISQMNDPASFATAAIDIANNGWVSSSNEWILNLWPPGFILLEALIIKMLGAEAPVILVLQILSAMLFSIVLVLLYDLLSTWVKSNIAFTLPLLIFAFPVSRVFLLEPTGITLGENLAIGFFLLCIFLAFRAVKKGSFQHAVYAGLCLALSAYFRSQFELILLALTGWGVLLIMAIKLTRLRNSIEPELVKSVVKTIAITLLVAHAASIPWRAYHWINQGKPFWVATAAVMAENSVMTSVYLNSVHGEFVVEGAGNLVCRIEPTTCGDTVHAKQLFVKTFMAHPIEWYKLKSDVIGRYWFSSIKNWSNISAESTYVDIIINGLFLIMLIVLVSSFFAKKIRSHGLWILLLWFNASLFSAYTLIFTLAHFEVRYFYFPKIAGIVMLLIVACLYYRQINHVDFGSHKSK
jgi:hypothetical protein